jgi:glutaredoxin-related protein
VLSIHFYLDPHIGENVQRTLMEANEKIMAKTKCKDKQILLKYTTVIITTSKEMENQIFECSNDDTKQQLYTNGEFQK